MPTPRIYVETTIPSAYHTRRTDPAMLSRRDETRQWWEIAVSTCELVTSPAVLRELARGRSDQVSLRRALVKKLPLLIADEQVDQTVAVYVQHKIMPRNPEGRRDALGTRITLWVQCAGHTELPSFGESKQIG